MRYHPITKAKAAAELAFQLERNNLLINRANNPAPVVQQQIDALTARYNTNPESFYTIEDKAEIEYHKRREALKHQLRRCKKNRVRATNLQDQINRLDKQSFIQEYIMQYHHTVGKENNNMQQHGALVPSKRGDSVPHPGAGALVTYQGNGMMMVTSPTPRAPIRGEWLQMLRSPNPEERSCALGLMRDCVSGQSHVAQGLATASQTFQGMLFEDPDEGTPMAVDNGPPTMMWPPMGAAAISNTGATPAATNSWQPNSNTGATPAATNSWQPNSFTNSAATNSFATATTPNSAATNPFANLATTTPNKAAAAAATDPNMPANHKVAATPNIFSPNSWNATSGFPMDGWDDIQDFQTLFDQCMHKVQDLIKNGNGNGANCLLLRFLSYSVAVRRNGLHQLFQNKSTSLKWMLEYSWKGNVDSVEHLNLKVWEQVQKYLTVGGSIYYRKVENGKLVDIFSATIRKMDAPRNSFLISYKNRQGQECREETTVQHLQMNNDFRG